MGRRGVVVYLGFGSNVGDRSAALAAALGACACSGIEPLRTSRVYESAYVGSGAPQAPYLNAVLEARTALSPLALLDRTQAIEAGQGRQPNTHSMPRPLDIDLLLYGGWVVRHRRLAIPHPRIADRRFVLQPLADLGVLDRRPALRARLAALEATQDVWLRPDLCLGVPREHVAR